MRLTGLAMGSMFAAACGGGGGGGVDGRADGRPDGQADARPQGPDGPPDIDACDGGSRGLFAAAIDYPVGDSARSLVAADFNGDDAVDLAVTRANDAAGVGEIQILIGDGQGAFTTGASYPAGLPGELVSGDFDGDGRLDLAAFSYDGQGPLRFAVLFGEAGGTFRTERYGFGIQWYDLVAAGDFNEDGKTDLVAPHIDEELGTAVGVTILLGPDFEQRLDAGVVTTIVAVGDVDGDHHLDLLSPEGVQWGDGRGGLTEPTPLGAGDVARLQVADLDNDGRNDVVISGHCATACPDGRLQVLRGTGAARSLIPTSRADVASEYPAVIATADFDDNGTIDLAVGTDDRNLTSIDDAITVVLGNGDAGLQTRLVARVSTGSASGVVAADLNGDGAPDLVGTNASGDTISVLINQR